MTADYARLSNALQSMDADAESKPLAEIIGVDEASLLYAITHRLGILAQLPTRPRPTVDAFTALYIDAFTLGKRFAEARAREATQ